MITLLQEPTFKALSASEKVCGFRALRALIISNGEKLPKLTAATLVELCLSKKLSGVLLVAPRALATHSNTNAAPCAESASLPLVADERAVGEVSEGQGSALRRLVTATFRLPHRS